MNPTPEEIAARFRVPIMGFVPPLQRQFPQSSASEFRTALDLLQLAYSDARRQWEEKWGYVFPELIYDDRLHTLGERVESVAMRTVLVTPEQFQFAGCTTQQLKAAYNALSPQQELSLELRCITQWTIQRVLTACSSMNIPVLTDNESGNPSRIVLSKVDPTDCLPEDLRLMAVAARSRFANDGQTILDQRELQADARGVHNLIERCESLEYQCSLLRER